MEHHQGQLLNTMGNGFSASFTQQGMYEDVARQAITCAEVLKQQALKQDSPASKTISLMMGVDTGTVPHNKDETLWRLPSEIERCAAQLAELAGNDEIILSKRTAELFQDEIQVETVADACKLLAAPDPRAGIPGRPKKHPSRFVGRSAELAFLNAQLGTLGSGRGQAVLLSGPAGIGKTRLVSEFVASQSPYAFESMVLHCLPNFSKAAMTPIRDLCVGMLALAQLDTTMLSKVDQALLRELLDASESSEPYLESLSDHEHRQWSYKLLNRIITEACRAQEIIVVLEDAHWMDATSQEYLHEIIRNMEDKKLFLVITTRPTDSLSFIDSVLYLSPLSQGASLELLKHSQVAQEVSDKAAIILVERAAGNPFFLEELALATHQGADPNAPPPETVQAVIFARISGLSPRLRMCIYVLAVAGSPASIDLIAYLLAEKPQDTRTDIVSLVKAGFVVEEMIYVSFRHMLINDTAYSMVSQTDRENLHRRTAQYLERHSGEDGVRPEMIAKHYQEAHEVDLAISYWIKATRESLQSTVTHETVIFADQGLALLDTSLNEHKAHGLYLELMKASALIKIKGFGNIEATCAYLNAQELNKTVQSVKSTIRILVGLWINDWVRGNLEESLSHARKLMKIAQKSEAPPLLLQAHAGLGQVLMHLGQAEDAHEHLSVGLAAMKDTRPGTFPEQNAAVSCAAYAAWTASLLGRSDVSKHYYGQSQVLAQLLPNPFAAAIHASLCACYLMHELDVDNCLALSEKAIAISREHNFSFWLGTGLVMQGWALGQLNREEEAFSAFKEGIDVFESTDAGVQLANWYGLKAETHLKFNQYQAALDAVDVALKYVEDTGDAYFAPRIHAVAQVANEKLGHPEKASVHAKEASELVKRFGYADKSIQLDFPVSTKLSK